MKMLIPKPDELLLGLACFLAVFGVLAKLVLPRIVKVLAEREDAIEGGLARAYVTRDAADRVLAAYRKKLAEARREAVQLIQEAREQGARYLAESRTEGQRQREALVASAHAEIAEGRLRAEAELRQHVGALAVELAGRIVGEPLHELATDRVTVQRFFAELDVKEQQAGVHR
jgi:F-type H+-transporting ATPase subunit b